MLTHGKASGGGRTAVGASGPNPTLMETLAGTTWEDVKTTISLR